MTEAQSQEVEEYLRILRLMGEAGLLSKRKSKRKMERRFWTE